jgi:hypothetical protein
MARYGFGYETFDASQLLVSDGVVDAPADLPPVVRQLLNGDRSA